MNDFISIPYRNATKKMTKTKDNKRIFLGGKCNELVLSETEDLIEK
jgi:hypothetical protein